jgi:RNA polymerase sigma-70 factor (ECF subfamily)
MVQVDEVNVQVADAAETVSREQERELIGRARAGDESALRQLVDLHKDRLFGFIWRMVRHHHDAEEICQDAFLKAFASLESFSSEYRFSTWLFTIGYRVCLNHLRRRRALTGELDFTGLPHEGAGVSAAALESEEAGRIKELVWAAVDRLSAPQRATLLLFYRQEFNCHEIGRVLGLPVATVKSHLHRGRNRLRLLLESLAEGDLQELRNRSAAAG